MTPRAVRPTVLLAITALASVACADAHDPVIESRYRVVPDTAMLESGTALQLAAALLHPDGDTIPVAPVLWSSTDPTIAEVDEDGTVTGGRTGVVTVTATSSFGQARAALAVERAFRAVAVSLSDSDLCALDADGLAWCTSGLHDGAVPRYTQAPASHFSRPLSSTLQFASLAATPAYNCGIDASGGGWCWGEHVPFTHAYGANAVPVRLPYGGMIDELGGGGRGELCVRGSAGLTCWSSLYGSYEPSGVPAITDLSFSVADSCGLASDGMAWCWSPGGSQQVGGPFTAFTRGEEFECGITRAGVTQCRGDNGLGQLGNGSLDADPDTWHVVSGGHSFSDVVAGQYFACARDGDGAVWCWGQVDRDQVVHATPGTTVPERVAGLPPVIALHASSLPSFRSRQLCGRTSDGTLWCWGNPGTPPSRVLY